GKFAYKITYRTKVINPSKPYSGQQTFRNTAILESPGYMTETHDGAQSIAYGDALAKRKVGTGSNYESSWEIEYNYNLASIPVPILGDFHIVDTFPGVQDIDVT
ncbi:hypothetical protein, partial [Stenotrophomonas maltophilia group sp. RNC7]|uniref:hypothetical protein n=1 Tax=Stenotrophomonas maltophilia group sp. RNC7 TaxID=3071467 RepID=UPI0027DFF434